MSLINNSTFDRRGCTVPTTSTAARATIVVPTIALSSGCSLSRAATNENRPARLTPPWIPPGLPNANGDSGSVGISSAPAIDPALQRGTALRIEGSYSLTCRNASTIPPTVQQTPTKKGASGSAASALLHPNAGQVTHCQYNKKSNGTDRPALRP